MYQDVCLGLYFYRIVSGPGATINDHLQDDNDIVLILSFNPSTTLPDRTSQPCVLNEGTETQKS